MNKDRRKRTMATVHGVMEQWSNGKKSVFAPTLHYSITPVRFSALHTSEPEEINLQGC